MVTDSAKDHVMSAVDPLYNTAVEDQMPLAQWSLLVALADES